MDYLNEFPTAAEILKAVYKVHTTPTKDSPSSGLKGTEVSEGSFTPQFGQLASFPGMSVAQPPDDFRDNFAYANSLLKKINIGKA